MIWVGVLIGAYIFVAGIVFALFSPAREMSWKDAVASLVVGVLWPIILVGLLCLVVVGDGDLA